MSLETLHRRSLEERPTLPDEPQPVKVADLPEPGKGACISRYNNMLLVQWRDAFGKLDAQGHHSRSAAITNALRVSKGRTGRREAAWTGERLKYDESGAAAGGRRAAHDEARESSRKRKKLLRSIRTDCKLCIESGKV